MVEKRSNYNPAGFEYTPRDPNRAAIKRYLTDSNATPDGLFHLLRGNLPDHHHGEAKIGMIPDPYMLILRALPRGKDEYTTYSNKLKERVAQALSLQPDVTLSEDREEVIYNLLNLAACLPSESYMVPLQEMQSRDVQGAWHATSLGDLLDNTLIIIQRERVTPEQKAMTRWEGSLSRISSDFNRQITSQSQEIDKNTEPIFGSDGDGFVWKWPNLVEVNGRTVHTSVDVRIAHRNTDDIEVSMSGLAYFLDTRFPHSRQYLLRTVSLMDRKMGRRVLEEIQELLPNAWEEMYEIAHDMPRLEEQERKRREYMDDRMKELGFTRVQGGWVRER